LLTLSSLDLSFSSLSYPSLQKLNGVLFSKIDDLRRQTNSRVKFDNWIVEKLENGLEPLSPNYKDSPLIRERNSFYDLYEDYLHLFKQKLLVYKNHTSRFDIDFTGIDDDENESTKLKEGDNYQAQKIDKFNHITILNNVLFNRSSLLGSISLSNSPEYKPDEIERIFLTFEVLRLVTYLFHLLQTPGVTNESGVNVRLSNSTSLPSLLRFIRNTLVSSALNPKIFTYSPFGTSVDESIEKTSVIPSPINLSPMISFSSALAFYNVAKIILSGANLSNLQPFFLLNVEVNNTALSLLSSALNYYFSLLSKLNEKFFNWETEAEVNYKLNISDPKFKLFIPSGKNAIYFNIISSIIETLGFLTLAPEPRGTAASTPVASFPLVSYLLTPLISFLTLLPVPLLIKYITPACYSKQLNEDGEFVEKVEAPKKSNPAKLSPVNALSPLDDKRTLNQSTSVRKLVSNVSFLIKKNKTNPDADVLSFAGGPTITTQASFLNQYFLLKTSASPRAIPLLLSSPFSSVSLLQLSHRLFCFMIRMVTSPNQALGGMQLFQQILREIRDKIVTQNLVEQTYSFSYLPHLSLLLFIHYLLPIFVGSVSAGDDLKTTSSLVSYKSKVIESEDITASQQVESGKGVRNRMR
jgi:hypothetical protein